MERTLLYNITETDAGMMILDFLRKKGFSRHILASMKSDEQAILLNNERGRGRTRLKSGDTLRIRLLEAESSENIVPRPMDLHILYEDEDILVLNKASNTPIHPSQGNFENTLANGVAYYFQSKGEPFVYRCINRLDRDTTGALILAKNALSAALLSQQMVHRQIKRTYLALATGQVPPKGTISAPIGRVNGSTIEREINFKTGEEAITHFECLDFQNELSLIELHLETGRTHQIRVHMKHIGHPLPGDFLYNPMYDQIQRQALHSYQLEFLHPLSGKPLLFTAPVPEDFVLAFFSSPDKEKHCFSKHEALGELYEK